MYLLYTKNPTWRNWERSRPQGPKNVHDFLMTVRPLSWACGNGTEMLPILKKLFLTWLFSDIFRYDSPKKSPTILYAVNLWLKPVSATWARVLMLNAGMDFITLHGCDGRTHIFSYLSLLCLVISLIALKISSPCPAELSTQFLHI